jgi:hypothetical protein
MTDAQVLRHAAKVVQDRSTKPRSLVVRTLAALLCSIAADIEREEVQKDPPALLKVEPRDVPFTDFDG